MHVRARLLHALVWHMPLTWQRRQTVASTGPLQPYYCSLPAMHVHARALHARVLPLIMHAAHLAEAADSCTRRRSASSLPLPACCAEEEFKALLLVGSCRRAVAAASSAADNTSKAMKRSNSAHNIHTQFLLEG
eukprot:1159996-Pelagomonas_calceolata.AAC.4